MRINTSTNQTIKISEGDIQRTSDFCYLGSIMSENGGASKDVNTRIQKAGGAFSKLRKVRLATIIQRKTKIKIFNTCVKSVLLCGCETWLLMK